MTKYVRLAALAAAATLASTPALAVPPGTPVAADPVATATARIIKPLTLAADENLDFGANIVVYGPGTVSISPAGVGSCGPVAEMTCDFTGAQAARYIVTGVNQAVVTITASPSTLTSGANSIPFTPIVQPTVTLGNSGSAGTAFNLGGSIDLAAATPEGVYQGDIDVTVEY